MAGMAVELPSVGAAERGVVQAPLGEAAAVEPPQSSKFVNCVTASNPSCPEAVCPSVKACDVVATNEPYVWGPGMWHALHVMAVNYPASPDEDRKNHCKNFLEALPYMLPCGECGRHLKDTMTATPGISATSCASRETLNSFMVNMHNHVNKKLGRAVWTTSQAANHYGKQRVCVKNATTWKSDSPL